MKRALLLSASLVLADDEVIRLTLDEAPRWKQAIETGQAQAGRT